MSVSRLPEEIWMEVFRYLSMSDKLNVRSCCRCFKRLVDRRSFWKNESVVLRGVRAYTPSFWKVLRCRMLTTVFVDDADEKEWQKIVNSLPWLRSVTVQLSRLNTDVLTILINLKELKSLSIRISYPNPFGLAKSLALLPQLEHLSVCFKKVDPARSESMRAICKLSNLTSLSLHPIPKQTFQTVLRSLPKLQHLSLRIYRSLTVADDFFSYSGSALDSDPGLHHGHNDSRHTLTSFELLDYMDPTLPPEALEYLPFLERLTVKYKSRDTGHSSLKAWLKSLNHLTELAVKNGHPFRGFADILPGTLRTLSLTGMKVSPGALTMAAKKVPNLLHLHYDPFELNGDKTVLEIPRLFPQLHTLKVRSHNIPEKDFLKLGEMRQLKRLVILDAGPRHCPISPDLLCRFQVLTDYRVQVVLSGEPVAHTGCLCDQ